MRDKTHLEQVERWAIYCKKNIKECQKQVTPFVNAQIENSNKFYKRLAKTKKGKEKIIKLKMLKQ